MRKMPNSNKASAWCLGISVGLIHPCILEFFTGKPHDGLKQQKRLQQPQRKSTLSTSNKFSKNAGLHKSKYQIRRKTSNRTKNSKNSILNGQKKITDYYQNDAISYPVELFADSTGGNELELEQGIVKRTEVEQIEKQNQLRTKHSLAKTTANTNKRVSTRSTGKYKEFQREFQSVNNFSIENMDWYDENYHKNKVQSVMSDFTIPKENRREGNVKLSYNYLLLDSRKCTNKANISWQDFIKAIFYIGKGKNKRAFEHAKEAREEFLTKTSDKKKCLKIKEIWNSGNPIKVFFVAENVIAEEAYTREAAMIDAMGLKRLCNRIRGSYYGVAITMKAREILELGATLLMEARDIFRWKKAFDVFPKRMSNIAICEPGEDESDHA